MRPVNCLMVGFAVIVGATIANPKALSALWLNLIYGFVTGFTLAASAMAINDYYDKEVDAINEPSRPIPSGLVKPQEALAFSFSLAAVGLLSSFLTNVANALCPMIALLSWLASIVYVTVGKQTGIFGNFLVSACVAVPFIYGSLAVDAASLSILIFASMAFLSNTGREIIKGIADVQGDMVRGVRTLAIRYGERKAARVAALFYLSAVALSPTPWLLGIMSFWFVPLVIVADVGIIVSSIKLLADCSRENAKKVKGTVLLWFAIALVAFMSGVTP